MTDVDPDAAAGDDPAPPRGRRRRWALAAAAVLVVAGIALGTAGGGDGGRAVTFRLPRVDDPTETLDLAAYRGRPVVVNFWASWCVPCRKEMPYLQDVSDRLGERAAVVGVNHQDGRKGANRLLRELGIRFPSGYDPKGEVGRSLGVRGLPTTIFVSAAGEVMALRPGELRKGEVEQVLAEEAGVRLSMAPTGP